MLPDFPQVEVRHREVNEWWHVDGKSVMISTAEGLCRGDICSRFSNLETISTYSRFVLTTISTESA